MEPKGLSYQEHLLLMKHCEWLYIRDAQPVARGPDPAPEGVLSGPRSRLKIQETTPE